MNFLKGFITIQSLINNTVNVDGVLGELSTRALTYSKYKGIYKSGTLYPDSTLYAFTAKNALGVTVTITQPTVDLAFSIFEKIKTYTSTHTKPIDRQNLLDTLTVDLATQASTISFGPLVDGVSQQGNVLLPEWITYVDVVAQTTVKIWYSDVAFRNQYDETEVIAIKPIPLLDNFFGQPTTIQAEVNAITPATYVSLATQAIGMSPCTEIRVLEFTYARPNSGNITFTTYWPVIIYGAYGDNYETMKEQIIAMILANSTHTRADWTSILPSLFKKTEFYLLPNWHKPAIPTITTQEGVYSPIVKISEALAMTKSILPAITAAHINNNLGVIAFNYKSLGSVVLGGMDNMNSKFALTDIYPDVTNVPTTSLDFARMTDATKGLLMLLENMLIVAETVTLLGDVPIGMRKLVISGDLYVTANYLAIQYLVSAKINYGVVP